jgi:hypothetical protein
MANTRNHNANTDNNNAENYNAANPPLPPPLTMEQVLVMQAQILQTMKQTMDNMQQKQQAPHSQ